VRRAARPRVGYPRAATTSPPPATARAQHLLSLGRTESTPVARALPLSLNTPRLSCRAIRVVCVRMTAECGRRIPELAIARSFLGFFAAISGIAYNGSRPTALAGVGRVKRMHSPRGDGGGRGSGLDYPAPLTRPRKKRRPSVSVGFRCRQRQRAPNSNARGSLCVRGRNDGACIFYCFFLEISP
jgi:hypothetical protein